MSKVNRNLGVGAKLVLLLLLFGLPPAALIALVAYNATRGIEESKMSALQAAAASVADKIDRNLFERYGDVQAFGYNEVIRFRDNWYNPDPAANAIARAMDKYNAAYGCYYLSILVDTDGRVIAVNSRDSSGHPLDTGFIYERNYAGAEWFRACMKGEFYTSMPFSSEGNDIADGTFVEHLHIDDDVRQAYPDDDAMTIGYSSPVLDEAGNVMAVWSNRTRFSLVEDFFVVAYDDLEQSGYPAARLLLLDADGRVVIDYDPTVQGDRAVHRDFEGTLFKALSASAGSISPGRLLDGESGYCVESDGRSGQELVAGYAHLQGALGFPGMNWGVLIRVPRQQFSGDVFRTRTQLLAVLGVSSVLLILLGWLVGARVARTLKQLAATAQTMSSGDFRVEIPQSGSSDEIGRLTASMLKMRDHTCELIRQVESAVAHVASASEELSAGADETNRSSLAVSRTIEQVASGAQQTTSDLAGAQDNLSRSAHAVENVTSEINAVAQYAGEAARAGREGKTQAEGAARLIKRATESLQGTTRVVQALGEKTSQIGQFIGTITGIADQTNLLALNAAIEAARAGEAGRGFAVVAEEVRKLAEESNVAAVSITGLVKSIEEEMTATISSMSASDREVNEGADMVLKTSEVLQQLVDGVEELSLRVQAINQSAVEIRSSTNDVVSSMQAVSIVAEENAEACGQVISSTQHQSSNMQEITDSASTLASLSQDLQEMISQFQV
ncbi:MAG: methyl-accepting chemotaxis protein [bacterium]